MSKYVDEIVKDIYTNKEFWCKRANASGWVNGIQKQGIVITNVGNTALFSVCDLFINGVVMITTYRDRFRLERAVNWWYRNIPLNFVHDLHTHRDL